jgi:hypothetical protein
LAIPYLDENGDGLVDDHTSTGQTETGKKKDGASIGGIRIRVATLGLYRLDEKTELWVKVPGAVVDRQARVVRAPIYHLGLYAIMGSLSNDVGASYAFPVPFVASRDSTIKFINLPDTGEIRIYAVTGELVKEIRFDPGHVDPLEWDVRNADGEPVGSDVYLVLIKSGGNEKKGKIVIVR